MQLSDRGVDSGLHGAGVLLNLPSRPTAIFAAGLHTAIGVYQAAASRGLDIPLDLSVVAFDDLSQAWSSSPALTRIRRPLTDMGALAAQTALRAADGETASRRVELPAELDVKGSTAPPAKR